MTSLQGALQRKKQTADERAQIKRNKKTPNTDHKTSGDKIYRYIYIYKKKKLNSTIRMIKPRNSHVKNASLLKRVLREDLKDANDATCLILTVFHGLGALTAKARSPLITSQDVGNKPAHQGTSRLR